jgi:gamma-glutamylcyclotransferase (GGCT)/AIG2-like uncharacterized protein YtfP
MTKVFVYGSLRKGLANHALLADSRQLGQFRFELSFKMYSLGGFPALVQDESSRPITGEVYEIDQPTFLRLDRLEGYPHFYDRLLIDTPAGEAWVYFLNDRSYQQEVTSGDWKEFVDGKRNQSKAALSA